MQGQQNIKFILLNPYCFSRQEWLRERVTSLGYKHIACFVVLSSYTILYVYVGIRGPGSSVGLATGYGPDGWGSNPGGGEIFLTCPDRPWGPPSLL